MQQNFEFSMADAARLAGSAEGQQLLRLLRRDGGKVLQAASAAMQAGEPEKAAAILAPLLDDPQAAALLEKLKGRR